MNYYFIKKYIDIMSKEDIISYSLKEGIKLNTKELDIIYNTIKNRYKEIMLDGAKVINDIKDDISINVYNKLNELYIKYKKYID